MALSGFSIPTTVVDDAGNAQKGVTLNVTGPNAYTGTVVTNATTGVFRLGPLPLGDYTVTNATSGRSAIVPVLVGATDEEDQTTGTVAASRLTGTIPLARIPAHTANAPAWAASTTYKAGDLVRQGGLLYSRKADGTSGTSFDLSMWDPAGSATSDASATVKGVVQLAGDLSGTAASPTVPGLSTLTTAVAQEATDRQLADTTHAANTADPHAPAKYAIMVDGGRRIFVRATQPVSGAPDFAVDGDLWINTA